MTRTTRLALVGAALACAHDDPRGADGSTEGTTVVADEDTDGDADASTDGETSGESETDEDPVPSCGDIDVPLVLDPKAPIYDGTSRTALAAFFDALVRDTGATVRVRPNAGTELSFDTDCGELLGNAPGDPVLVWGSGFEPDPDAADALDCVLDAAQAWDSPVDYGDWMFSGLMFPILFTDGWPTPADGSVVLPMLLGATDDELENMYSRPGMASESLLRNALDGDRRRWATFTFGDETGDELELFALTLGDHSAFVDHQDASLADGLAAWQPHAVQACVDHDFVPPPDLPEGCTKLDILFVVDGSSSMEDEKKALRGLDGNDPVFAEFTDVLLQELGGVTDFHVGVVSSEPGVWQLHTHRNFPAVPEGPDTDCGLPPGQRWIVGPSDTLEEQFACIAATEQIEILEETVHNAGQALGDPINEGFLREDSVLLVVLLTDEDTQGDATQVAQRAAILDAVGGRLDRVVLFGIAGDQGVFEMPKTKCYGAYGAAVPGRRLTSIVYSFRDQGVVHDLCAGTLGEAFDGVVDDVVRTCEGFHPEG
jgi:hypothetical protein